MELFSDYLQSEAWPVFRIELENVRVNSELFIKKNFRILPESFGDQWQERVYNRPLTLAKNYLKDLFRNDQREEVVLNVLDQFSTGGFFHWHTEIIPRLVLAEKYVDPEIPFFLPSYFLKKWPFGNDLLSIIDRKMISLDQHRLLRTKKMIFISQPGGPLNYQPEPLMESSRRIKAAFYDENFKGKPSKKIYITRKKVGRRVLLNEEELLPILNAHGFEILNLDSMSTYDQVNLFSRCEKVLSIHGAGLTNMVYMPRGSKVVEIRRGIKSHMLNFFFTLSQSFDHRYYYLLGDLPDSRGMKHEVREEEKSIRIDPEKVEAFLKDF